MASNKKEIEFQSKRISYLALSVGIFEIAVLVLLNALENRIEDLESYQDRHVGEHMAKERSGAEDK